MKQLLVKGHALLFEGRIDRYGFTQVGHVKCTCGARSPELPTLPASAGIANTSWIF